MNHPIFYIGLAVGLALAAGLRVFLPALLAGGLAYHNDLGVGFPAGHYHFLRSAWWLGLLAVALAVSYFLQARVESNRLAPGPLAATLTGCSVGVGAVLFAGTLAAHGDTSWPGWIAGGLLAALANAAVGPLFARVRSRLQDRGARLALNLYLDGAALLLAAVVAALHPLGYVALALLLWFLIAGRRRSGEKYAGLRILRR